MGSSGSMRSMIVHLAILLSVLITAILSGVLGMAGGMILMAILAGLLPVAAAMTLHGAVQAFSNGSRAWFLRTHVRWTLIPRYLLGAAIALTLFITAGWVPDAGVVLIAVGCMPWLARVLPRVLDRGARPLDGSRPATAVLCGVTVTSAQLLAVVATKAVTQNIGHLLKLGYYGTVMIRLGEQLPVWVIGGALLLAVLGARIGTRLLDRLDDIVFRKISAVIILALGVVSVAAGLRLLWQ